MLSLLASKDVRLPPPPPPISPPHTPPPISQIYGYLFSNDESVVRLVSQVMPLVASFQVADGLAGSCGGVLRGQGRQHLGAAFNIVAYYVLALPLGITLAFRAEYGLQGLWIGAQSLNQVSLFPLHNSDSLFLPYRPSSGTIYRGDVRVRGRVARHKLGTRSRKGGVA